MDIQEPLKDSKRRSNWTSQVDTEPVCVPEKINSTLKHEVLCCLQTANEPAGSQTSSSSIWSEQQWFSSSLRDEHHSRVWDWDILLVIPNRPQTYRKEKFSQIQILISLIHSDIT